jgi:hypothetical protein
MGNNFFSQFPSNLKHSAVEEKRQEKNHRSVNPMALRVKIFHKEQITKIQDPVIRMQLQELLNKKRQRRNKGIRKIEEPLDSVLRQTIDKLPPSALHVLMLVMITIILFIIFMLLECRA